MPSVIDILDEAGAEIETELNYLPLVNATDIGLDIRAGRVRVDTDNNLIIAIGAQALDYYGGFEYVDKECIFTIGAVKIYTGDDERVMKAIEYYIERNE